MKNRCQLAPSFPFRTEALGKFVFKSNPAWPSSLQRLNPPANGSFFNLTEPVHLGAVDWTFIGLFLATIAGLGLLTKLKSESAISYIVAGRALSIPAFVATLVVTWYGSILGIGESVSFYGIGTWLLLGVPYYLFGIIYALTYAKRVRNGSQISIPERIESIFGRTAGITAAALIFLLAAPAANVYMLGVLLHTMIGWPTSLCVGIGALVGAAFLYRGGLLADVKMSLVAFVAVYLGFIVLDLLSLRHGSPLAAVASLHKPDLLKIDGGQGPLAVISFMILGAWTMVDPGFHQRVTSASAPGTAQKGVFVAVGCFIVSDLLTISAGLYALQALHPLPADPVAIFPRFADAVLPVGVKGLFFVGLIAISLASLVGYTLVCGATFGRDIVGRIRTLTEEQTVRWTRIGLFVSGLVSFLVALTVHSVLDIWYSWAGALVGSLLFPTLLSYRQHHTRSMIAAGKIGIPSAMLTGFIIAMAWMFYGMRTGNPNLTVTLYNQSFSLGTLVPAALGTLAVLIVLPLSAKKQGNR